MAFTIMSLVSLLLMHAFVYSIDRSLSDSFFSNKVSQPVYTLQQQPHIQHHLTQRQSVTSVQPNPNVQKEDIDRAAVLTCQFWREQYEKDGYLSSKKNRDRTCAMIK